MILWDPIRIFLCDSFSQNNLLSEVIWLNRSTHRVTFSILMKDIILETIRTGNYIRISTPAFSQVLLWRR